MPITLVCTGCGKSYQLKDELAGRKVRCPGCQSVQVVPDDSGEDYAMEAEVGDEASTDLHAAFNHDKFLLRQKLMTIGSKYVVWDEQQQPILFIERPRISGEACWPLSPRRSVLHRRRHRLRGHRAWDRPDAPSGRRRRSCLAILFLFGTIVLTFVVGIGLSPKRHIDFYADESRTEPAAEGSPGPKRFPITATYTVLTPEGDAFWAG